MIFRKITVKLCYIGLELRLEDPSRPQRDNIL